MKVTTAAGLRAWGARLGRLLRAGDLVVLSGPLGAGKTVLAQGIAEGLGVAGQVTSPTFVIAREHPGDPPLIHVDAYRLGSFAEVDDLDLDLAASVVVVEWGEGLVEPLAAEHLRISLDRSRDDEVREVTWRVTGAPLAARLAPVLGG